MILREALLVNSEEIGREVGEVRCYGIGISCVTTLSRQPIGLFINGYAVQE